MAAEFQRLRTKTSESAGHNNPKRERELQIIRQPKKSRARNPVGKSGDARQPNDSARAFGYRRVVFVLQIAARKQLASYSNGECARRKIINYVFSSDAS